MVTPPSIWREHLVHLVRSYGDLEPQEAPLCDCGGLAWTHRRELSSRCRAWTPPVLLRPTQGATTGRWSSKEV